MAPDRVALMETISGCTVMRASEAAEPFTLDCSDDPSNAAQEAAIADYTRWANKHAKPKRSFAPESKIRRPDYLPNAA
jgi:hypothetical protein